MARACSSTSARTPNLWFRKVYTCCCTASTGPPHLYRRTRTTSSHLVSGNHAPGTQGIRNNDKGCRAYIRGGPYSPAVPVLLSRACRRTVDGIRGGRNAYGNAGEACAERALQDRARRARKQDPSYGQHGVKDPFDGQCGAKDPSDGQRGARGPSDAPER
eukprot:1192067-Prorocentrum_minimum.AAC.1